MPRLALSFLGSFQVTLDGQPVHSFRVKTAQALLAYLAVEADRPHHRETLAGLLWADVPNATALNHLRHTLSDLRKAIDAANAVPCLHITRNTLQFNLASDCRLDVATFQDGARSTDPARQAQAVAVYRGPFLDGFSLNTSPAFEEWLVVRQQQYAQLAVDTLFALADGQARRGEYRSAQRHAQRLLELEPWHEGARGLLMQLLALDGRRAEALAQYDTYRRLIDQELGVPPAPELTAQYDRLRAGQPTPTLTITTPHDPPHAQSRAPFDSPATIRGGLFVAREAELARLAARLETARGGPGQLVFVAGEAGSGKTTLIDEFIRQAMLTHGDVLAASGTCNAHVGPGDPYLPVREIVQLLTGDIEAKRASGAITPEHARRLWDSLPDTLQALVEHGPDLIGTFVRAETLALRAEAFASTPGRWPARLAELANRTSGASPPDLLMQFTAALHALAQTRTLILALDDLQWADEATLNWLFYLSRNLSGSRCLILGAYRPADVALGRAGQRHPLDATLNELQRHLGEAQINLDHSAGRAFIDALLDAEPNALPVEFRDTLYRHTGGNALFTVELISGLKSRGELVRGANGGWVAGQTLDWEQLPVRVEAVIAERINRVPTQWQALLEAACVEGDEFTAEVVADAIGWEAVTVTHALSGELSQRYQVVTATRLERPGAQRLTHYRFRHSLFEKYLYQRLAAATRARLHEAIGTALEKHYADRPAIAPQLARQFEAAGLALKAADYWRLAGQRAARLAAYSEALAQLAHGLALLTPLPNSPERAQCELSLQLALGAALLSQGWATADRARVFDRVFELAQQTGATIELLRALYALGELAQGQGEMTKALTFGQELLRLAAQSGARLQLIQAHYLVGSSQCITGHFVEAGDQLERALALIEEMSNEAASHEAFIGQTGIDLRVISLAWLALARWLRGDLAQAETYYQQMLQRTHQIDHPLTSGFVLVAGALPWLLLRGELAEAQVHLARLSRLAEQQMPVLRPWDKVFTGYVRVQRGDYAGLAQLRQGIADWAATGTRGGYVIQHLLLMQACLRTGQYEAGLQVAAETLARIEANDQRLYEAELRRVQGELWLARGDRVEATACFQAALRVAHAQGAATWAERAAHSLARWQP